ncbi:hypothetical protein HYW84_03515 [Candidatus Peregrinibacteria bacterium]|nr:hypothetical protein [Candidatus Peregrinibacteria bacterium]
MSHSDLPTFISHARHQGMDHQTIRMLLLSAGWKEKDVSQALASESLELSVPLPPDSGNARDAFFHLLGFTALTAAVISMIFLFFDFLDRMLPDPAFQDYYDDVSSVRWKLAVLFVSYPLFLWMARLLHKEYARHPEKLASGIRRWLTYLILFVTACALMGDLIALIFSLLQGEVTARFFLKVIVLAVMTGLPFRYYLYSMRVAPERFAVHRIHRCYLFCSAALVLIAVVGAFIVTGSPLQGRSERFDEERLNDLRAIQSEIFSIVWAGQQYNRPYGLVPVTNLPKPLPASLEDVVANAQFQRPDIADPETGNPYRYLTPSDHEFQLCAKFDLVRDLQYDVFWNHPSGEHCYSFDALELQVK